MLRACSRKPTEKEKEPIDLEIIDNNFLAVKNPRPMST